jgi:hypothetical protein
MIPDPINPAHKSLEDLLPEMIEQGNQNTTELVRLRDSIDRQTRARHAGNVAVAAVVVLLVLGLLGLYDLQSKMCPLGATDEVFRT